VRNHEQIFDTDYSNEKWRIMNALELDIEGLAQCFHALPFQFSPVEVCRRAGAHCKFQASATIKLMLISLA
jgi:hypothetical protein